jgi:hypothetical protein
MQYRTAVHLASVELQRAAAWEQDANTHVLRLVCFAHLGRFNNENPWYYMKTDATLGMIFEGPSG